MNSNENSSAPEDEDKTSEKPTDNTREEELSLHIKGPSFEGKGQLQVTFKKGEEKGNGGAEAREKTDEGDDSQENKKGKSDNKKDEEGEDGDKKKEEQKSKKPPLYKRPAFIITASIILVILVAGIIVAWLILRHYVFTDDAYIDGHITQVSPRAAAQVIALHVRDNQMVHQGDLLIELDPTDYQVALLQAQAQLASAKGRFAQAQAQLGTANASVTQANAETDAAQVQYENARRDLKRLQDVDQRARSQEQLDNAATRERNANAQLEQAKARQLSALANVTNSVAAIEAAGGEVKTSEANIKRAEVNLSYCKIFAPTDGRVTERTVEQGNYVAIGQALFMLVDPHVWVTANFKETQLTHMRTGQPVVIKVDAYPGLKWKAHVDSIQAGSGSRFSVLPAENATGNYVKVVQRVPVKIIFDDVVNTNDDILLSPGLSVTPRVQIR